jgi:hypothetical protein
MDLPTGSYGYAEQAIEVFDREGLPPGALRMEMAILLAAPDPARAAHLVTAVVAEIPTMATANAISGLQEFVARTRHLDAAEIREARQLIHDSGVLAAA